MLAHDIPAMPIVFALDANPPVLNPILEEQMALTAAERSKRYAISHPERFTADARRTRRNPSDIKYRTSPEYREAQKRYRSSDVYRNAQLRARYGITLAHFNQMLKEQNGLCAVCLEPLLDVCGEKQKHTVVDHCHTSKRVRGILHNSCNLALGWLQDNPTIMRRAADYIEKHKEAQNVI